MKGHLDRVCQFWPILPVSPLPVSSLYLQETQKIQQYHYNAWPDHLKPTAVFPIIRMIEVIHKDRQRKEVPIVVHCSAGCGRTGTIIAIDILREIILNKVVCPVVVVVVVVVDGHCLLCSGYISGAECVRDSQDHEDSASCNGTG